MRSDDSACESASGEYFGVYEEGDHSVPVRPAAQPPGVPLGARPGPSPLRSPAQPPPWSAPAASWARFIWGDAVGGRGLLHACVAVLCPSSLPRLWSAGRRRSPCDSNADQGHPSRGLFQSWLRIECTASLRLCFLLAPCARLRIRLSSRRMGPWEDFKREFGSCLFMVRRWDKGGASGAEGPA